MSLVFDQVSFIYPGTQQGVHEVSMQIATGELVAVIGPSGSGKSTLLNLVSGLASGHRGAIVLDGDELSNKPVHERNIGMVFQNYALFPHLDVVGNVAYGLKLRGVGLSERQARAKALLELVSLGDYANRSVAKLSGGQQQRVALARALAISPKALLLDEPLAALDASIRGHLRDEIRNIQRRFNATTLLVTHDQEEALTMADRVAVMDQGKLIQIDTPRQIYDHPRSRVVARFVGLSTILEARVVAQDRIDVGFTILATPTAQRSLGSKVFALVRPECVEPDPLPSAINCLHGAVGAQRYLGSVVRYDFSPVASDTVLLVESRHPARASVAISPDAIRLLDE